MSCDKCGDNVTVSEPTGEVHRGSSDPVLLAHVASCRGENALETLDSAVACGNKEKGKTCAPVCCAGERSSLQEDVEGSWAPEGARPVDWEPPTSVLKFDVGTLLDQQLETVCGVVSHGD